jgi:hypothetical protein
LDNGSAALGYALFTNFEVASFVSDPTYGIAVLSSFSFLSAPIFTSAVFSGNLLDAPAVF